MAVRFGNGIDLQQTAIINAILHPVAIDPSSPVDGQVWYRTDTDRLMVRANGVSQQIATMADLTGGSITGALWDAQSYVKAISDNTPVVQVVGSGEIVGRPVGGDLGVMTPAQVRAAINVEDGATADQTPAEILAALLTVDGVGSGLDADTIDGTELSALATTTYVDTAISNLVDTAPGTLDTLNELAAALGDDPNFAATVAASLATKTGKFSALIGDGVATTIPVTHSLGSKDVTWAIRDVATDAYVITDAVATSTTVTTFTFAVAPGLDALRATIIG